MTAGRVFQALRTPLTLIVLLVVLYLGFNWGWERASAPIPPPPPPTCINQPVPEGRLTTEQVTLRVLNGSDQQGLARRVGDELTSRGFRVTTTGNTDEVITSTIIVGAAEENPEVQLIAAHLPEAAIRADGRSDRSVDVLVGSTFEGFAPEAPDSVEIQGESICLPSAP
ncbi:LytR C-terminal domain-containing protein [Parenemella sanctibonifatiensis]|uniref:LytR/CpsA/Psr regulator C-terminal domain-containing protein n=1 Tax=Parenemella sanctibonifatiensis TaxID=2016505 RepID=A0A255EIC9_9ACTN|nr:LytR C-terminal domain-containing protein [Parenemella sanctibonifatiensis]OYN89192.1 hypothetical protein CGZ92_03020 [Parenemella sanctibonifatiensis]